MGFMVDSCSWCNRDCYLHWRWYREWSIPELCQHAVQVNLVWHL